MRQGTDSTRNVRRRAKPKNRRQQFLRYAPVVTALSVTLFGVLPLVLVAVVGIIQNRIPEDGWLGTADGYPFWYPPFWLLWIPGVLALAYSLLSIPESGKFPSYFWGSRLEMWTVAFMGLGSTFLAIAAYEPRSGMAMVALLGVWILTLLLILLRGLAGLLRIVPASWR